MAKTNEKGPRKLDKDAYQDIIYEQTQNHQFHLSNQPEDVDSPAGNHWRKGNDEQPDSFSQPSQFKIEEKKASKHAKRRAKKKIIVTADGIE